MAPSSLKFEGDKESWSRFKRAFLAWCTAQRLDKFLLNPLPALALAGAGVDAAKAAEEAAQAAGASAVKKEKLDHAADEKAAEQWHQRAAAVYASLVMALTGPLLEPLVDMSVQTDAHGLWKSLTAKYESKTVANQSQLWQQFITAHQVQGESIGLYVLRLQRVVNQLRALNTVVDPTLLRHALMNGLVPSFKSIAAALRTNKDKSYDELVVDLEEFEECLQQQQAQEELQQAHFSRQTQQRGGGNQSGGQFHCKGSQQQQSGGRPKGPCFTCDQMGHVSFDCPKLPKETKKCTKCRRLGHIDRQCQRRGQQQPQQQPQQQQNGSNPAGGAGSSQPAYRADQEYEYDDEDVNFGAMEQQQAMSAHIRARYATQAAAGSAVTIAWLDSGASLHTVGDASLLSNMQDVSPPTRITIADGSMVAVHKRGQLAMALGSADGPQLTLSNVACDPRLVNLVSVGCLTKAGCMVSFTDKEAVVRRSDTGKISFKAERIGNVYVLVIIDGVLQQQKQCRSKQLDKAVSQSGEQAMQAAVAPSPSAEAAKQASNSGSKATQTPVELWHNRLGHVHLLPVEELSQSGAVHGMPRMLLEKPGQAGETAEVACGPCALGKKHRHTFKTQRSELYQRATKPGERLFTDLSGRITLDLAEGVTHLPQSSVCPSEYLSVTVDEATGLYFVWGLQYKSDAPDRLMKWLRQLMREKGAGVPQEVVTDGGGEYIETTLKEFLAKHGILHKPTQDHTQQHNGQAERAMRTIFEMACCMMQAAQLPPVFWLLAGIAAAWVINRTRLVKQLPKGGQQAAASAAAAAAGAPQPTMVTAYEAFTG